MIPKSPSIPHFQFSTLVGTLLCSSDFSSLIGLRLTQPISPKRKLMSQRGIDRLSRKSKVIPQYVVNANRRENSNPNPLCFMVYCLRPSGVLRGFFCKYENHSQQQYRSSKNRSIILKYIIPKLNRKGECVKRVEWKIWEFISGCTHTAYLMHNFEAFAYGIYIVAVCLDGYVYIYDVTHTGKITFICFFTPIFIFIFKCDTVHKH